MHATTIIAYTYEGAAYCPDCGSTLDHTDPEVSPIFAAAIDEGVGGTTCDSCGECLSPSGDWLSAEDITDRRYYQWPVCGYCNHTEPRERMTARERLELRDEKCRCCARKGLKLVRRGPWAVERAEH